MRTIGERRPQVAAGHARAVSPCASLGERRRAVRWFKHSARSVLIALLVSLASVAVAAHVVLGEAIEYERRDAAVGEEPGMWCAHPTNPDQLVGVTSAPQSESRSGNFIRQHYIVRVSTDGGRRWKETLRTEAAPIEVDPACAYGVNGEVFVIAMANFGQGYDGAHLWRSPDGGLTWGAPIRIDHARFFDRPHLSVDLGTSAFRGRLYIVAWGKTLPGDAVQRPDEMVVYMSDDGGASFSPPTFVPTNADAQGVVHPGETVVLPDGTFVISWTEVDMKIDYVDNTTAHTMPSPGASKIMIARSTDGGRSFGPPVEVATSAWQLALKGKEVSVGKYYPSLAVDRTTRPFQGQLYIAWSGVESGRQQILLSRSSDGGKTWGRPSLISDGHAFDAEEPAKGPHDKMVSLRVNRDGVVGAFYYAQSDPDPKVQFWPVFTASFDGGLTWSHPDRVLAEPVRYDAFNLDWSCTRLVRQHGALQPLRCWFPGRTSVPNCNYGLVADAAGRFHLFAFSNPNGRPAFATRTATARGEVTVRAEADEDLHIDLRTVSYDPTTQTVLANAQIENVGSRELRAPIRLVVDGAGDTAFVEQRIEILNADNGRSAAGAWWDFGSARGGQTLTVGERSAPRQLKLRFRGTLRSSISSAQRLQLNLRTYRREGSYEYRSVHATVPPNDTPPID
jgi:hypothetical protein